MGNKQAEVKALLAQFETDLEPVETGDALRLFTDNCTGAQYCECHVQASKIVAFGTVDAPLDPEEQPAFRANREILGNQPAFLQMKDDARRRRSFSNIVAEYTSAFDAGTPLKVIGGQHRFAAIETALDDGVDELHGLKVYFGLTKEQRIDVQLISNTNLAINGALVDRLRETFRGPALRDWCHDVGLLKPDLDFGDKPAAGGPITVHLARTFIANFYRGAEVKAGDFVSADTTPVLFKGGKDEAAWEAVLAENPDLWKDANLKKAGKEFVRVVNAQKAAFEGVKGVPRDWKEKALNGAVLSAWAFIAGHLQGNSVRLLRHYGLADKPKDPLNADMLAGGRHKTDSDSYRGLGYRTDARERAQMVELFHILAEDGSAITKNKVNVAIYQWFAKRAALEAKSKRDSDE